MLEDSMRNHQMKDFRNSGIRKCPINFKANKDVKIQSRSPKIAQEEPQELIRADHFDLLNQIDKNGYFAGVKVPNEKTRNSKR